MHIVTHPAYQLGLASEWLGSALEGGQRELQLLLAAGSGSGRPAGPLLCLRHIVLCLLVLPLGAVGALALAGQAGAGVGKRPPLGLQFLAERLGGSQLLTLPLRRLSALLCVQL